MQKQKKEKPFLFIFSLFFFLFPSHFINEDWCELYAHAK